MYTTNLSFHSLSAASRLCIYTHCIQMILNTVAAFFVHLLVPPSLTREHRTREEISQSSVGGGLKGLKLTSVSIVYP